jgi:iron complex transport system substrate-binding protein
MAAPRLVATVLAAGVALSLTACGPDPAAEAGDTPAAATRTVTDTFAGRSVEVPARPERVVALWRTGAELVDIGLTPVGILDGEIEAAELGAATVAEVGTVPTVGTTDGVDVEKVIALKPDLIVGMDNKRLKIDYEELRQVAPTVILGIAEPTDVWDNYPKLAEIVGRTSDFTTRNAQLQARLAGIARTYGDAIGKVATTSLGTYESSIFVDTGKSLTYRRVAAAGFGYNRTYATNPDRYVAELSAENIPSLDDQGALFYEVDITGRPTPSTRALIASPSFTRLVAVRAGRLFPLTSGVIYTFAAAQRQVDDLEAAAEKLAGRS